jgi:hypothetical protein
MRPSGKFACAFHARTYLTAAWRFGVTDLRSRN